MKLRVLTLFLAAALTVSVAAGIASAATVTIYSENFEGANVGDGLAANLGWTLYDWSGLHDIHVGQGLHPEQPSNQSKAADGSTVGGYYGSVVRPISIPENATSVKLTYSYYAVTGAGVWGSRVGFWSGIDGEWDEATWIEGYWTDEGWNLNTYRTTEHLTYVMDEWVTGTIEIDLVNMMVQGSLVGSWLPGAKYTPVMPITNLPTKLWYISRDAGGNCGLDIDNIVVTAEVPSSSMSGTITLGGWISPTGDNRLTPMRVELVDSSTGSTVFDEVVPLGATENLGEGTYTVGLLGVPSGTYNVYFTAVQWLRELAAENLEILEGDQEVVNATLTNGDIDGDNGVTSTDLSVVLMNLGVGGDW